MRAAVIRSTDVDPEPRTEQAIKSLVSLGFEVTLLNWQRSNKKVDMSDESFNRISFTMPAKYGDGIRNLVGQSIWQLWIAKNILTGRYNFVYACDADTALMSVVLQKIKNFKLIYDQFDPISSRFHNQLFNFLGNQIEKVLFRMCHLSVVASKSRRLSGIDNQIVVSNSFNNNLKPLKRKNSDNLNVAYFGVLQPDRGLFELLKCLERDSRVKLTIAGFGNLSDEIKSIGTQQLSYLGKLEYEEGIEIIATSDVSYVMYNPTFVHNRNAASGKFLDSVIAGTPCVVADGTILADYTREFNLGWVVEYGNVDALGQLFGILLTSRDFLLDNYEFNRKRFLKSLGFSNQEKLLTTAINDLLKDNS
jgi:glycosyltransferase involved in cell wall biosynthesis